MDDKWSRFLEHVKSPYTRIVMAILFDQAQRQFDDFGRCDDLRIEVTFPDGNRYAAFVDLLAIPFGAESVRMLVKKGMVRPSLDAEHDESRRFAREMNPIERVDMLASMRWCPGIAVWLMPPGDRSTVGDMLSRRGHDLDVLSSPFTYTQKDWNGATFMELPGGLGGRW